METVKFRTNIGCADCLKVASILLNADTQILYWHVEMDHPERLLTVMGCVVNPDRVVYNLRFAGFKVERTEQSRSNLEG
jgi:copper chaperone